MDRYLLLFCFVVAVAFSYQTMNTPSTAYKSCQDALRIDPMAIDGYYYITNNDVMEPYLTFCLMSVNGGGWTLYYKNSNSQPTGSSYSTLMSSPQQFLQENSDFSDPSVVGFNPVLGLKPIAVMSMVVGSTEKDFSAIYFSDVDVADSLINLDGLVEGCNRFSNFTLVETGKENYVSNGFNFVDGSFNFRSCAANQEVASSDIWLGDVNATDVFRVISCGGLPGTHCMYLLREESTAGSQECYCHSSGYDNAIWPATPCGETREVACHAGSQGVQTRYCGMDGVWSDYVESTCSCPAVTEFGTNWPATEASTVAHVRCANNIVMSRDRECLSNGEWSSTTTGGCTCNMEVYKNVAWSAISGGNEATHLCDVGAAGEAYHRMCNVDGTWSTEVTGGCLCPELQSNGVTWEQSEPLTVQTVTCEATSVGTEMTRTCSAYGTWMPIEGNCDCPEEVDGEQTWPQTPSGMVASLSCASGAVGGDVSRECFAGGIWSNITSTLSCSCPQQDWANYAGTHYLFPQTEGGMTASLPCANDPSQTILRTCNFYGEWETPAGCYEPVYCPAETIGELSFEQTEGGNTVMVMCQGISTLSIGRICKENGEWMNPVGYCDCPAETDSFGNVWPRLVGGESYTQDCPVGFTGTVTRSCSSLGAVTLTENTCERVVCPAEETPVYTWPATDSMSSVHVSCESGLGHGLTRNCLSDGTWSEVTGSCSCMSTVIDGVSYPESAAGAVISSSCPNGYSGAYTRRCGLNGEWMDMTDECERITCPAEVYESVSWPQTESGNYATVDCPVSGYNRRYCSDTGVWSSSVSGSGCNCEPTTVNANGTYTFSTASPNSIVTKQCVQGYTGTISYQCARSGEWTNLVDNCQRITCEEEYTNGIFFESTFSGTTLHIPCEDGAVGSGYDRYCQMSGLWSNEIYGECKCPSEVVRHDDGHLYTFPETAAGEDVNQVCAADLAGSIARQCSVYGKWNSIRGECLQLQCSEELLDNYLWPVTNSSTTVSLPCQDFKSGSIVRTCYAAGVWSDPVDECEEKLCQNMLYDYSRDDCLVVKFDTPAGKNYIKANVIPSSAPGQTTVFQGRTVRMCGLSANVPYNMFVQYCSDVDLTDCSESCMINEIYYKQTCDVMSTVDIVNVDYNDLESSTITFSSVIPTCPIDPVGIEIELSCTENCGDFETLTVQTTCASIGGCTTGSRVPISFNGVFPREALFSVKQRMVLSSDNQLQEYSAVKAFRIRDLLHVNSVEVDIAPLNSRTIRVSLNNIENGPVAYRKHIIYVYKKFIGTRRLVDSLFSTVTLCPEGEGICEEYYADIPVEAGYDYSFSIYSYPLVSDGKVSIASSTVAMDPEPTFTMVAEPSDYSISLVLSNALYDLTGQCYVIPQHTSNSVVATIAVELPQLQTVRVAAMNLEQSTAYAVTCMLRDETGYYGTKTLEVSTTDVVEPELSLEYSADTIYDVTFLATANKPVDVFCSVSAQDIVPTAMELSYSQHKTTIISANIAVSINILLDEQPTENYRVSCVARDTFVFSSVASIIVEPSNVAYAPVLISTTPVDGETGVAPNVQISMTFRYPVVVNDCQFCFFILYNVAERKSTNLYSSAYSVNGNVISFRTSQLASGAGYQIKASTAGLIHDATFSDAVYVANSDVLFSFSVKQYSQPGVSVIYPDSATLFPVNGVIEISLDQYMFLNEGSITLNSRSIDASNTCLQIRHASSTTTTLLIPVAECTGLLRSNTTYVLVVPSGFLQTRDQVTMARLTYVFNTAMETFAPEVVDSFPPHMEMVPTDVSVKLYFNQPVVSGSGYLFISEYNKDVYVNSYNLPASKATFGDSYPFEVAWDASLFSLKPSYRYVISWSEGLVMNAANEPVPASTVNENVEFLTDVSGCSPSFIAEHITSALHCTYEKDKCVCKQWNLMAMTQKEN